MTQKGAYTGNEFIVCDEAVSHIAEQIEVNEIRNFLSLKESEEDGAELEDLFQLTPCNEWICEQCGYLEFAKTDKRTGKGICPSCGKKSFIQKAEPIEWLWPKLYPPKLCDLSDVYDEIYRFLKQHIVLPDETLFDILTAWVISSWKTHRVNSIGYIQILGTIETGKTRLLELLNELCYHSIIAVAITPAAIARVIDNYEATILLDQAEKLLRLNTDSGVSLYGICLSGYRKGMRYTTADQNDPYKVISKNVFGPKAFTSERTFDPALTSRCISIRMHRDTPFSSEIDYDWAQLIRQYLLYYRYKFDFWDKTETILKGRTRERYISLLRVINSAGKDIKIAENYARQEKIVKDVDLQTTDNAIILKVILDELDTQERQFSRTNIFLSTITEATFLKPESIGWRLRNMGIPRSRSKRGMYINFTPKTVKHLKQLGFEYGLIKKQSKEQEQL